MSPSTDVHLCHHRYTFVHVCTCKYVRACVRACVRVCMRACVHACVHACVRACISVMRLEYSILDAV